MFRETKLPKVTELTSGEMIWQRLILYFLKVIILIINGYSRRVVSLENAFVWITGSLTEKVRFPFVQYSRQQYLHGGNISKVKDELLILLHPEKVIVEVLI